MKKFIKNYLLLFYLIINILFVFINSILDTYYIIDLNVIGLSYLYACILNLIVCLILLIYRRFIKRTYKLDITDLLLIILITLGCISTVYAIVPEISLHGFIVRKEGLYAVVYYYSLFFISRFIPNDKKKIIIYLIFAIGIFEVFYASLQKSGVSFVSYTKDHGYVWAYGTFLNPNFFSSFMMICVGYALGLFLTTKDKYYKVLMGLLSVIFSYGLYLGNSMSCYLSFILVVIYAFIYAIKNKRKLSLFILFIIVIIIGLILSRYKMTYVIKDFNMFGSQIKEISNGNKDESFGTNRLGIWKETINVVPKYIWHGAGIDNYYFIYGDYPMVINNKAVDKAHNEYLQVLVTEGIFALITYLLLIGIVLIKGLKKEIYLMLPTLGYAIQAFFNISVIAVAPFFFISLGLLYGEK
jgi:putative inorganic carbon (HCO3(-)) transporter